MKKIEDLIIPGLTEFLDESLEKLRTDTKLSEEEFRSFLKNDGQPIFELLDEKLTDLVLKQFTLKYLNTWKVKSRKNQATIIEGQKRMFLYFFAYLEICFSAFNRIKEVVEQKEINKKDGFYICLYGNLCRMADEIGVILSNGYTSAALILWRSFYEHAVVAIFLLSQDSEDLIDRFEASGHRDLNTRTESYIKRHKDLKFPPLEKKVISSIEERSKEIKDMFGGKMLKADYGWASSFLDDKPTFRAIEAKVEMDRYRPFYIWACGYAHPNFESLTNFRNENGNIDLNLVTRQKTDAQSFIDPLQLTLGVFQKFNDHFLLKFSVNHQYSTNLMLLNKIFDKMAANFS